MSAHRRVSRTRHAVRRTVTATVLTLVSAAGFVALAEPAHAAGPWFVKTAALGGNNGNTCLSSAQACATITGVLAKPGFVNGDTINVAAGQYNERPIFTNKGATIIGSGSGASALTNTIISNNNTANASTFNVQGAVTVSISNLRITAGTGTGGIGGGIRVGNTGNIATTVNTNDVVIDNNKAVLGAGVAVFAGSTYNATNTTISGNVASGTNAAGGGVYNAATMTMTGGAVSGNTAPLGGGLVNGGNLTMTGTAITGNTGSTQGGGLYNATPAQLTNTTITGNSSPLGGGIYNAGGTASVGTAAAGSGGSISSNTSTNVGGGIYVAAGTLNVNNATMTGNTATNGGGAAGAGTGGTANLSNSAISNSTGTFGGALYNAATMNVTSSTVSGSQALQGGAAYNNTGGTLSFTGSSVTGNSTTGAVASTQGGGIVNVANLNLTNSAVNNNTTGNQGGGISSSGTVTMNGGSVNGNNAATGAGIVNAGTFNATGGSVSNNTAVNGGALYNTVTANFDGTTISGNTANGGTTANGGNAGAVYNANAVTLKNATLTGNKVVVNTAASPGITGYGGAILNVTFTSSVTPAVTLTDTAINGGNVSGGNAVIGGAIASYPTTVGGSTGTITGTRLIVSKNVAGAAGGIFSPGALTLTGSTVDQNQATHASGGNAGGIYAGGAPVVLDDTDVTANTATVGGGGAYLAAGSTAQIRNGSTVSGNTAVSGAGVYNASALTVKDSAVTGNNASYAGAGLFTGGVTTLTDSTITGNSAAAFGGGILTAGAALNGTGGEISGNDAFAGGGVIVGAATPVSFDGTDFKNNVSTGASSGGGAILSAGNLTVKNATLSGNKADPSSGYGGAIYSGSQDDNVNASLKVENSTLTGNEAFGAAAIVAGSSGANSTNKTSIVNSTIHANASSSAIGALQLYQGSTITGTTITDNTAGGAAAQNVGGIVAAAGVVGVSGTVVSGNTGKQCFAAVADGGYNLTSVGEATCGFSGAKNDVFAAHGLDQPAANGGQTDTRLPASNSPVLDRIPANTATGLTDAVSGAAVALCTGTDQRGTARPQGAKCDIGAVEKEQVAPTVSGPADAEASVGNPMAPLTYTSTGSPQPTLSATGLPNGVTIHDNGDGTATISGTPAANTGGSYNVVVKATNEAGSATTNLTLVVKQAPTIGGPAAATYTTGQAGGPTTFTQTSGFPQALFSSNGTLPGGVGFADNGNGSGSYSGTPAGGTGGIYNLTVKASNGTAPDATAPFTLTVNEAAGLTGPATATFQVGTAGASGEFVATGFPVPALTSTPLPGGLTLTSTGSGKAKISGTAANGTGGVYNATVTASNGVAADATKNIAITVNEAPEITGPSVARFVAGSPNTVGFVSDGYPQATLSRTGTLPAGLTFADNGDGTATLSGTAPTSAIGTYTITVKAANGVNPDATQQVTVQVVPPLAISSTTLIDAAYKTTYSAQIQATGGQPAYTFTLQSGSLPAGLTMAPSGLVTGSTTAAPGTYTFTAKATDTANPAQTATKQITIKVVKGATVLKTTPILLSTSANGDIKINIALFEADLSGGFPLQPIAGETVKFRSGSSNVCSAKTDANGHVKCQPDLITAILVPLKGSISATYAGNTYWNPATSSAGLFGTN